MSLLDKSSIILPRGAYSKAGEIAAWNPQTQEIVSLGITQATSNLTRVDESGNVVLVDANVLPRDFVDGGCGAFNIWPQRTNILTYSSFDADVPTNWTVGQETGTYTHTLTTYKGQPAITHVQSVSGRSYLQQSVTLSSATDYTFSIEVDLDNTSGIDSGDIIFQASGFTGATGDTDIQFGDLDANGKASITFTTDTDVVGSIRMGIGCSSNDTGTITFAMPQLELGTYKTAWIPTEATTETRDDIVLLETGLSALFNQTLGAIYAEVSFFDVSAFNLLAINKEAAGGSGNDYQVQMGINSSGEFVFGIASAGSSVTNISDSTSATANTFYKMAGRYKSNDSAFYVNGTRIEPADSGGAFDFSSNNLDRIMLSDGNGTSFPFFGGIRNIAISNDEIINTELDELTT